MPPTVQDKLNTYPMVGGRACTYRWRMNMRQIHGRFTETEMLESLLQPLSAVDLRGFTRIQASSSWLYPILHQLNHMHYKLYMHYTLYKEESRYHYKNQGGVR